MIKEKKKTGRPEAVIDEKQFTAMCQIQCTQEEICAILDVDDETLVLWCRRTFNKSFPEIYSQKRQGGKVSLRRAQWKNAEGGNTTMQIWLGKQYLKQTDQPIQEYTEREIKITYERIDVNHG